MLRIAILLVKSGLFYLVMRVRGVRVAEPARIRDRFPILRNAGYMQLGRDVRIRGRAVRTQLGTSKNGRLIIGNHVGMNDGVNIYADCEITIDDGAALADNVVIQDSDFHPIAPGVPIRRAPVHIGRNAWLGRNSIVMPGVTIGAHAVVAAGAVVTRDVPPHTVVAGVPARVLRTLEITEPDFQRW